MRGKINRWNDEKGFGFISVESSKNLVFFHISSVKTRNRRPEIGDLVEFTLGKDSTGKPRATSVAISGLAQSNTSQRVFSRIEPPKKNLFDYLLILVALTFAGYFSYRYWLTQNITQIWPYLVPAAIALILLGRTKKPAQESFSCAKCRTVEKFGSRTLAAWNRGITRLFCGRCHDSWVNEQPKKSVRYSQGHSGCLGMLLVLALPPVIFGTVIYQLLA